jgi:porin
VNPKKAWVRAAACSLAIRRPGTDPQRHNRYGTTFSSACGTFMIGEAVAGAAKSDAGPRPWVDKFSAWYHTGGIDAQRRVAEGLSLADPTSTGAPKRYRHNQGACAIAEVPLCRGAGQSLAAFARGFTQQSGRNALAFQVDVCLPGQPLRTLGRHLFARPVTGPQWPSCTRNGPGPQGLRRCMVAVRDYETVVEVNYGLLIGHRHFRPLAQ